MNDYININKLTHYNKIKFLENLEFNFNNSLEILDNLKKTYNNFIIKINGNILHSYLDFLSIMASYKNIYLRNISLLINRFIFSKPIELLKKNLGSKYHIILCKNLINFNITIHCLAKQAFIKGKVNIFKLDNNSNIIEDYYKYITITIDFSNSEPVIFNLIHQ